MWENKSFKKSCILHWSNSWCCEQSIRRYYKWGGKCWGYANQPRCSSSLCLYRFGYTETKWILPESMAINEADVTCLFEKNIEALKCVFLHFEDILVKTFPGINVLSLEEFILVVYHAIKHFNTQIHPPLALWQYLYGIHESKSWLNIFSVIEICMCAPCSNATLERFFSQLCAVKSVWCNRLRKFNTSASN